jgi:hypothetical protein
MANVWQQALSSGCTQWEAVIRHIGWLSLLGATCCALRWSRTG